MDNHIRLIQQIKNIWLDASQSRQPYVLLKKIKLQELYRQNINENTPTEVNNVSMLINILCGDVPPPSEEINDKKITHPIEAIMHTNFLPPLKGTSYELCKLGHMMENVYGKQLIQMSDETNGTLLSNGKKLIVLHMCRAGLVSNICKEYQKDSPDFKLFGILDEELFWAVVEMKARCSSITAAKERRRINLQRQCACISYYSNDLRKYVLKKSEAVQVSIYLLFKSLRKLCTIY